MRVSCIACALQTVSKTVSVLRVRQHFFVAGIAAQQLGVILEGFRVGVVSAEFFDLALRHAIDILNRGRLDHLARPVACSLDAEQIMCRAAVAGPDFLLTPTGFQCSLRQHELGWNTGDLTGCFRISLQTALEGFDMRRALLSTLIAFAAALRSIIEAFQSRLQADAEAA